MQITNLIKLIKSNKSNKTETVGLQPFFEWLIQMDL